jgi:hypothetical protein
MADRRVSIRRQARAREVAEVVSMVGGAPAVLLIGRCIEVWADDDAALPQWSAMRRYGLARDRWSDRTGLHARELWQIVPCRAPWSADYIGPVKTRERLSRAGMTIRDLPRLRREAQRLLEGNP